MGDMQEAAGGVSNEAAGGGALGGSVDGAGDSPTMAHVLQRMGALETQSAEQHGAVMKLLHALMPMQPACTAAGAVASQGGGSAVRRPTKVSVVPGNGGRDNTTVGPLVVLLYLFLPRHYVPFSLIPKPETRNPHPYNLNAH